MITTISIKRCLSPDVFVFDFHGDGGAASFVGTQTRFTGRPVKNESRQTLREIKNLDLKRLYRNAAYYLHKSGKDECVFDARYFY